MLRRLLLTALLPAALVACAGSEETAAPGGPVEVAAGFYPYAFVAQRVGGDDVTVTNLTPPGAEPHDLELSPQQVAALQDSDLVLYARGFQPALDEAVEQSAEGRAFDVHDAVELREGAHEEHEGEEHEGEEHEGEEHEGEQEQGDPHVWLDPVRLATIAGAVADQLSELAPEHADAFEARALELTAELKELDADLRAGLAGCARTSIVTSHDAFGYLADAYGLEQVALSGLSPEDEASPKRLAEIARYAQEAGVTTIFFEQLVSPKVAESLAREVGAQARALDPLEGSPAEGDYLTAMRDNLTALRTALDCP